ncbi:unnamed protein product, partial [Linum tenue]
VGVLLLCRGSHHPFPANERHHHHRRRTQPVASFVVNFHSFTVTSFGDESTRRSKDDLRKKQKFYSPGTRYRNAQED